MMMKKLAEAIRQKEAPIAVGLDTQLSFVPGRILDAAFKVYGATLEGAGEALLAFNKEIIDSVCDLVPAVKLQSAMYEMYGVPGMAAYRDTIAYCHEKELYVIGDVKRGDIGSTSAAYAAAHIGTVYVGDVSYRSFDADFATVNPYLGSDGITPFLDACRILGKGIFVLVKTSNPSGAEIQDLTVDGHPLYERIARMVEEWGKDTRDGDYNLVGAVTGATFPEEGKRLRELMPHTFFLVPGYGAQGAGGRDLKAFFRPDATGAIVNNSRGIIAAWQTPKYGRFADDAGAAAREALLDMKRDIAETVLGKC